MTPESKNLDTSQAESLIKDSMITKTIEEDFSIDV